MASAVRLAVLSSVLWISGCNVLGQAQAGPTWFVTNPYRAGGEAAGFAYADMRAGDTCFDCHFNGGSCEPPESAVRVGLSGGVYARGSRSGFDMGVAPGIFAANTNAKRSSSAARSPI